MKKAMITLICLFAMLAAGSVLKAQEAVLELYPGWTWISYPSTDTLDFATVFDSFTPMTGDYIKSQMGYAEYYEGYGWFGSLTNFMPCKGFMYKSNRTEPAMITVGTPLSQQAVTTMEPSDITAESAVVGGTVTIGEGNHIFARGVCWGTEPLPNVDGSHTIDATVTGSQTVTLDNLSPSTTYYVRAYVATDNGLFYGEVLNFTTESGGSGSYHDYVDLGLPSGILWATCNVGAFTPEDYGDYFAWGETQPKDMYNWSTYQYCNGSGTTFTKYCSNSDYGYSGFTDNLTTLLPEDDAATANWGSGWRIPTSDDWYELRNNTTCTWTTRNGVSGRLFTASNGNSLFLPAAGSRYVNGSASPGSGVYWSSSLNTDYPDYARDFFFNSDDFVLSGYRRFYGVPVRAVHSPSQNLSFYINVTSNPMEGGSVIGGGTYQECTNCTLIATANEGYTFTSWTENGEVVSWDATYSFMVNGNRNLVANFVVSGTHSYVDLGLPSGTLWATCNVGAFTPEGYGDYFAWGETEPKSVYNWSTYQYCNGSNTTLTKYCSNSSYGYNGFTDNLTILLAEDDAATVNWGADWRVPSNEEWEELLQNTTCTWITQNGIKGQKFTAPNGNSLFLPAAGCRYDNSLGYTDSYGFYWSNSFNTDGPYPYRAWSYWFRSDYYSIDFGIDRYYGQSVRAVRSSGQSTSYIINATADPAAGGEVSGGGAYQEGSDCMLTATANEGYTFSNWTENGEVVSVDASYVFTVNSNRTLVANFTYVLESFTVTVTANPIDGGTITGGGNYQQGHVCTLIASANTGYTFTSWTEDGEVVSTEATYSFTVNGNRNLVANFAVSCSGNAPTGAINGKFTINASGDQVYFSQGNLQYIGSSATPYWKFADNQWDYFGEITGQNSTDQNVDRDLFGWSTSGSNHSGSCYQPWSTSTYDGCYLAYGGEYNLFDHFGNADWGYNAISNGGNQQNQWRTLTTNEWGYVFNTRTTGSGIRYAKANVNNVNGVILLPDDWSISYYTLSNPNSDGDSYSSNIITAEQWSSLEQYGAVFLPAAGYRNGTSVTYVGSWGYYWSASYNALYYAFGVLFRNMDIYTGLSCYRHYGQSVRLVAPAEN